MTTYSKERKEFLLDKLLPPANMTVVDVSKEEGVPQGTLYTWLNKAKESGAVVPGKKSSSKEWSAETKLAVVIESATLSESELSEYCRKKGLYVEQIKRWKSICLSGFAQKKKQQTATDQQAKTDKAEIKALKKDLRFKEKALAETAALLVLRKKLRTFWEESNEEN
jgi:transposase-like protein